MLDASALLALLNDEPGADQVKAVINGAVVSSVNLAEVASKLADYGISDRDINEILDLGFRIVGFGIEELAVMAELRRRTSRLGLSLADRVCLATALQRKERVLTADRVWMEIEMQGLEIEVLAR